MQNNSKVATIKEYWYIESWDGWTEKDVFKVLSCMMTHEKLADYFLIQVI